MRKSTIFISAVLTTFALVMLYNVASAYRNNQNATEAITEPTATAAPELTLAPQPTPTDVILTPQEAAQLATQIVGNGNLLSAESSNLNGLDAYKVTFTNNDIVYVGLDGQILSVQVAPVVVNVALPEKKKHKNNNNTNVSSGESHTSSEENHEEHED